MNDPHIVAELQEPLSPCPGQTITAALEAGQFDLPATDDTPPHGLPRPNLGDLAGNELLDYLVTSEPGLATAAWHTVALRAVLTEYARIVRANSTVDDVLVAMVDDAGTIIDELLEVRDDLRLTDVLPAMLIGRELEQLRDLLIDIDPASPRIVVLNTSTGNRSLIHDVLPSGTVHAILADAGIAAVTVEDTTGKAITYRRIR